MGVKLRQDISVLNVQQWMLKKNLAKKNNYKGLILVVIIALSILAVSFVKYTQSNHAAMRDEVLIQQYSFTFIQTLGMRKKVNHG